MISTQTLVIILFTSTIILHPKESLMQSFLAMQVCTPVAQAIGLSLHWIFTEMSQLEFRLCSPLEIRRGMTF